jgi:hypothetical protein
VDLTELVAWNIIKETNMTLKARRMQMYRMRDYRSQKRLTELKVFLYELREKITEGKLIIPEDIKESYQHAVKIAEQI